jgi:hypothetical protein
VVFEFPEVSVTTIAVNYQGPVCDFGKERARVGGERVEGKSVCEDCDELDIV